MSPERLEHLLSMVGPYLQKKRCRSRESISPSERLVITLRFLASGDSQQSQSFNFRVGKSTVCQIVRQTCQGIWNALNEKYLTAPTKASEWKNISEEYFEEWNFPHCLGALDGKHVAIDCPRNAGSEYYNYKHYHSMVLLALCDAKYCFTLVDIGGFGRDNDAGIFAESSFGNALLENKLDLPVAEEVNGHKLPYVIVADDIFPLKPWLMKPYGGQNIPETSRIYNYRLSRARRTIENAFGILSAKWRIFRRPIRASPSTVEGIIKATVCLHNYLRLTDNANYTPQGFCDSLSWDGSIIEGDWRNILESDGNIFRPVSRFGSNNYSFDAKSVRTDFENYFCSPAGSVSWQLDHVRSCSSKN